MAERMLLEFAESGHPIFRATKSTVQRSTQKKGHGKSLIHHCADLETIETIVRTITSVNQLSLYGAVAEVCEEYETFHDRTRQPVVVGQSSSSFVPSVIKTQVPLDCDDLANNDLLQQIGERIEKISQQDRLSKFCTNAGFLNVVGLQNSTNSQMQWLVVRTLCQETKKHLHQKLGSERIPKLGPSWNLQPAYCRAKSCLHGKKRS